MSEMFKVKNGIGLKPKNLATIVNPVAGDVACDESDNKIKFYDVSTSTWKEMRAVDSINGQTGTVVLTKSDVGLSNVDNTSDANKPISTATQAALDDIKQDLDIFYEQDMERLANTADFSTGNNAAFMGGGTLQGTLSLEEVAPISGTKSLKYVQAVGSVNDYFASPVIDLDLKQKNNTSAMTFYFEYDGNDNDGRFVVYDVTNSREIASEVSFVKVANKATRYSISFYIPDNCNQIRWGYKVLVQNTGKILLVDDVELSMNPFQAKELSKVSRVIVKTSPTSALPSWYAIYNDGWVEQAYYTAGSVSDSILNFLVPMADLQYTITSNINATSTGNLLGDHQIGTKGYTTSSVTVIGPVKWVRVEGYASTAALAALGIIVGPPTTSNILLPSDTFSSDSAPLTYASSSQYNLTTLANAPIGTYITFTYAANSNTRTQTTTRPTQTDADMNVNGMQIFTRAYNAASTAASPAAFAIQIGKGMKGTSLGLYKSAGKQNVGILDYGPTNTVNYGFAIKGYESATGILLLDCGINSRSENVSAALFFSDGTTQNNGYLTINAGRTLPLLAVPTPLVAYLKDVKLGSAGGTFTAGAWQTRSLNTIEGDSSIVSLSSNQFTLAAGKYEIEASAQVYNVSTHVCKIRNITDSIDAIIGETGQYVGSANLSNAPALLKGLLTLTTTKVFELQHRCTATQATTGFGVAANFGVNEVFATVKIRKIG